MKQRPDLGIDMDEKIENQLPDELAQRRQRKMADEQRECAMFGAPKRVIEDDIAFDPNRPDYALFYAMGALSDVQEALLMVRKSNLIDWPHGPRLDSARQILNRAKLAISKANEVIRK